MRRRLIPCLAAAIAALAALAAPAGARTVIPVQPKLRGEISAVPAKPAARAPATPTGAAPIVLWTAPDADAADCRRACAQTRYFCDANANTDDCAANWGQCVAGCSTPNLATPSVTGPAG